MATFSKLPSGKHRAQVRKAGIYRAKTFDRKADAKTWAYEIERAISSGASDGFMSAPKDMTLGQVIDAYLTQVRIGRTGRCNLERIRDRIGQTNISNFTALTLADFITGRKQDGAGGVTLASDLSNLSSALKWARHVRRIDINDQLAVEARRALTAERISTRSVERTRIPTQDEIDRLVAHLDGNLRQKIPVGTMIRFAASSAMRLGEICAIQIEDIRWNEKAVLIRARKDPQNKDTNDQVVPLVGDAFDIARQVAGKRSEGRLFPYESRSASAAFSRATRKLSIDDLHFHDLRHLAITELFRRGLPIQLVAVVSGHKDWKHLKRYTQLDAADVHSALDALR